MFCLKTKNLKNNSKICLLKFLTAQNNESGFPVSFIISQIYDKEKGKTMSAILYFRPLKYSTCHL